MSTGLEGREKLGFSCRRVSTRATTALKASACHTQLATQRTKYVQIPVFIHVYGGLVFQDAPPARGCGVVEIELRELGYARM